MSNHTTTRLTFIHQACIVVENGDTKIACDPWFNAPVWIGAGLPFPPLMEAETVAAKDLIESCTHIYLSHDHEDHWDPVYLKTLSRKTILVGAFRNKKFLDGLEELKDLHEIIYIPHLDSYEISPEMRLKVYLEQPDYRVNSMCLISTQDSEILNGNDCGLDMSIFLDVNKVRQKNVPLMFLYTINHLAAGYPIPYLRQSHPDAIKRMEGVRDDMIAKAMVGIRKLRPDCAVLFAGPNVYVDEVNDFLNDMPDARDWSLHRDALATEGCPAYWPAPLSVFRFANGKIDASDLVEWDDMLKRPRRPKKAESDPYEAVIDQSDIKNEAEIFYKEIKEIAADLNTPLDLDLVLSAVPTINAMEDDIFEWHLVVPFRSGGVPDFVQRPEKVSPPWLQVITTGAIHLGMIRNEITWNLLYGGRARMARNPDSFNSTFHQIMLFGRDPWAREALKEWMNEQSRDPSYARETIQVEWNGASYEILRYCPHEQEDLAAGDIEDGCIICLRHRWRFDLETGRCLRGNKSASISPPK